MDISFGIMFVAWLLMTCAWWDARLRVKRLERLCSDALDTLAEANDECMRRGDIIMSLLVELDLIVEDALPEPEEEQ